MIQPLTPKYAPHSFAHQFLCQPEASRDTDHPYLTLPINNPHHVTEQQIFQALVNKEQLLGHLFNNIL